MAELSSEQLRVLSALDSRLRTAAELGGASGLTADEAAALARSLARRNLAMQRTLSGTPRWVITSAGQGTARRHARLAGDRRALIMSADVFTWDWREQAPWEQISAAVNTLARLGRPAWLTGVENTGGDCYAVVVSDLELTAEQAQRLYETPDAIVKVRVSVEYPGGTDVDTMDVPLSALIGLDTQARENKIIEMAADLVNNVCSWGAEETGTVDYPDEEA
jgi:hypothetical protein